jgi:hypothetical protein
MDVHVHFNLHLLAKRAKAHARGDFSPLSLWAVKDPRAGKSGLVVAYAKAVDLVDVEFVVQEGGRQAVIASGQRSVHAYARATLVGWDEGASASTRGMSLVRYDPWRNPSKPGAFYRATNEKVEVRSSSRAYFGQEGAWAT